tara:strand:+ start:815 stop:1084 length:270 start_codon:yes stop_codon:yes gene_type:complete
MMEKVNITVKDLIAMMTIVIGIVGNYFLVTNQVTNNEEKIIQVINQIEHLEQKDSEHDLIQNTLINDVKYIKEQTEQIYQIVVLNSISN